MKFGNIEFSDELMKALRDDKLVVFAGAGISIPEPSSLPSFKSLIKGIKEYFQVGKSNEESVDQFLGRLEALGHDIRTHIAEQLTTSKPNKLHKDLLDIRPRDSEPKLVTTNFDRLFEATDIGRKLRNSGKVYTAPALPPGGRFNGIVNVHGVADQPNEMVLTDSDIGRAYLEERWALEFLQGLFRMQYVLFVGYSHKDPIIRYLARAMPTGNQPARRFILTDQPTAGTQSWSSLGIEPILYQLGQDGKHDEAAEAIAKIAEYQRRSQSTWQQLITQTVSQPNPPSDTSSQNIADRALQDAKLTPTFTANAQSMSWIQWCSDRGYLTGVFDDAPLVENHLLLQWIGRLLVGHGLDEAIDVLSQNCRGLHPQLWQEIIHLLCADGNTKSTDTVSRWTFYLLSESPANQDARKPDGLHQLANLCITHELYRETATIFEELCQPDITVPPRQRPVDHIVLATLGEPWMLSDTWAKIRNHLDHVVFTVLGHAVRQIENRHRILQAWEPGAQEKDTDSSRRHLIEESQYNYRKDGIDEVVNAARDCLEWISVNKPELLDAQLDNLIKSPAPLARRLAIHTLRVSSGRNPHEKIDWLFMKSVPLNREITHDTEKLLIDNYNKLSDDDRRRIVDAT